MRTPPASALVAQDGSYSFYRLTSRQHAASFWPILGPFLVNREIHRELEGPIFDSPEHVWIVALAHDDATTDTAVAGWSAVTCSGKVAWLTVAYVVPVHRGRGLHRRMVELRLKIVTEWEGVVRIRAATSGSATKTLRAAKFKPYLRRGTRWVYYERKP